MASDLDVDLLIIGGGINGAGIARDAAGRGLRVMLVEQGDLAGATSSASSKMAHGGLRYLERGALRLVRESLHERETLLRIAPHLVRPLEFVLPCAHQTRPAWQIRIGLWLYDTLGGARVLSPSRSVTLAAGERNPLRGELTRGFVYSDCQVDDARLVVVNARDAADRGAAVLTHTRCVGLDSSGPTWRIRLESAAGERAEVSARAVVNAAGPWVSAVLGGAGIEAGPKVRLVKGSHIVVPRRWPGDAAFLLQNDDGRVVFVLPFEDAFTLIGTTDIALEHMPGSPEISDEEVEYLCRAVNRYLSSSVHPGDIVWSFAGVRSLYDDGVKRASEVTRDYRLTLHRSAGGAPLVSVFGGKLTTFRRLAERVMRKLAPFFASMGPEWTAQTALPGGSFPAGGVQALQFALQPRHPGIPAEWVRGLVRRHGTHASDLLAGARTPEDLGEHFGAGLTAREVDYLIRQEWASRADDILWRRSKLGLRLGSGGRQALERYLAAARIRRAADQMQSASARV